MESVNASGCTRWHGALAMLVADGLGDDERPAVLAHLEGCAECRREFEELGQTVAVLNQVELGEPGSANTPPASLNERVLADLRGAGRQRRRRFASLGAIGVAAAVTVFVVVSALRGASPRPGNLQRTFALAGSATAHASVVLEARSWGTAVTLHERGLPGGVVYTVSMRTAGGTWWAAGSYRSTTGQAVNASMACAVALSRITGVRVVNAAGATVLASYYNDAGSSSE
jgi:hypothetical protein